MTLEQNLTKRRKRDRVVEGTRLFNEVHECISLHNDYVGAIDLLREGIDLYNHHTCWRNFRLIVNYAVDATPAEKWELLERQADEGSASAQFYLGYTKLYSGTLFLQNIQEGKFRMDQACAQGHGYALYLKGGTMYQLGNVPIWRLVQGTGDPLKRTMSVALELWEKAERLGVSDASNDLSNHWYSFEKHTSDNIKKALHHASLGAQLKHPDCMRRIDEILMRYPREATPWSLWRPSVHWACAPMVKEAIFTWLLISSRTDIPKGVILMICEFVCTETTNEKYCDKWPL